jgi:hypothetical protein
VGQSSSGLAGLEGRSGSRKAASRTGATERGHHVDAVQVAPAGAVLATLSTTDRTLCGGTTTRRFAVTWRLADSHARALSATKRAGQDPGAAC